MAKDRKLPEQHKSSKGDIDAFLEKASSVAAYSPAGKRGRLIFALDATASRQPSWDHAMQIQAAMFQETASLGGLDIQLAYYRGFGEFKASAWHSDGDKLLRAMTGVMCLAGRTQIARVLKHALKENKKEKVGALIFIGDSMEEDVDHLGDLAGRLGLKGVPVFLFHEGRDPVTRQTFEQIAKLSGGACCSFDASSPKELRDLLAAVAVFVAGGRKALADYSSKKGGAVKQLTHQMR